MTQDTKMELVINQLNRGILKADIELQTILQLLVKHSIVTREEVQEQREIVGRQPKYAELMKRLDQQIVETSTCASFETLFTKMMTQGRESLTPEELKFVTEFVDQMEKST